MPSEHDTFSRLKLEPTQGLCTAVLGTFKVFEFVSKIGLFFFDNTRYGYSITQSVVAAPPLHGFFLRFFFSERVPRIAACASTISLRRFATTLLLLLLPPVRLVRWRLASRRPRREKSPSVCGVASPRQYRPVGHCRDPAGTAKLSGTAVRRFRNLFFFSLSRFFSLPEFSRIRFVFVLEMFRDDFVLFFWFLAFA